MFKRRMVVAGVTVAALAASASAAIAGTNFTTTGSGSPVVYHAGITNQHLVLGPQSSPTTLVVTPPLKAGSYSVAYQVGVVMGGNDQVVCAAWIQNDPTGNTNDGVFGTAGNGSPGGIYGSARAVDVIRVQAGQQISLGCNSFNFGHGTYAGEAQLVRHEDRHPHAVTAERPRTTRRLRRDVRRLAHQ